MKLDVKFKYKEFDINAILIDNESVDIISIKKDDKDFLNINSKFLVEIEEKALSFWFDELDKHNEEIKNKLNNYKG